MSYVKTNVINMYGIVYLRPDMFNKVNFKIMINLLESVLGYIIHDNHIVFCNNEVIFNFLYWCIAIVSYNPFTTLLN